MLKYEEKESGPSLHHPKNKKKRNSDPLKGKPEDKTIQDSKMPRTTEAVTELQDCLGTTELIGADWYMYEGVQVFLLKWTLEYLY